jgi:hypothetical protein
VAVVWRERLHLFWLTFMEKFESTGKPHTSEQGGLGSLPMSKLVSAAGATAEGAVTRTLDVQLSWSEHFQGEWTTRVSSGFGHVITPAQAFDPTAVSLSVSKEYDSDSGAEGAVWINLHGLLGVESSPLSAGLTMKVGHVVGGTSGGGFSVQLGPSLFTPAFRVVSKNSSPQYTSTAETMTSPYSVGSRRFNDYVSSGSLSVSFVQTVVTTDGVRQAQPAAPQTILKSGGTFALLPTSNRLTLPNAEFAPLISPVFYADDAHTFFVEPSLTETTVDKWEGYVIPRPSHKPKWEDYLQQGPKLGAVIPPKYFQEAFKVPKGGPIPDPIDPRAVYTLKPNVDELTQPDVGVQFGDVVIDGAGRVQDVVAAGITRVVTRAGGVL